MLYVRDLYGVEVVGPDVIAGFRTAVPEGAVTAHLSGPGGEQLGIEHTDYCFYSGYAGLVLTVAEVPHGGCMYDYLKLEAKIALKGVRAVWLDRAGCRVQRVRPYL